MEDTLITNKAGALPTSNFNFIIPSDQTELGYISPVFVLGLNNSNGNTVGTNIIEEIIATGDGGQLFEIGLPDSDNYFTISMSDMVLDLGTPNFDESEYSTPTLTDQEMALKG